MKSFREAFDVKATVAVVGLLIAGAFCLWYAGFSIARGEVDLPSRGSNRGPVFLATDEPGFWFQISLLGGLGGFCIFCGGVVVGSRLTAAQPAVPADGPASRARG